jgi:hypothetical protein
MNLAIASVAHTGQFGGTNGFTDLNGQVIITGGKHESRQVL